MLDTSVQASGCEASERQCQHRAAVDNGRSDAPSTAWNVHRNLMDSAQSLGLGRRPAAGREGGQPQHIDFQAFASWTFNRSSSTFAWLGVRDDFRNWLVTAAQMWIAAESASVPKWPF